MPKYLKIVEAKYAGKHSVWMRFNDGVERTIDFGRFLKEHPHPQYNRYWNTKQFQSFQIENGNLVWGKNWDLIFPMDALHRGDEKL
jgi:hypothetical protein